MPLHPYGFKYINGDGRQAVLLDHDDMPIIFDVLGRTGDFGSPPYDITYDESPDGAEAAATGILYSRGELCVPVLIRKPQNNELLFWEILDEIADVFAPTLSDGTPNRGWVYFSRRRDIAVPDVWRMPVVPRPFILEKPVGETLDYYITEIKFVCLSAFWEQDPPARENFVLKSNTDMQWSEVTVTEIPGGNAPTPPEWTFTGPLAGQDPIQTIKIDNQTTGDVLEMTNLNLQSGQTLRVTTAFLQKDITIDGVSAYSSKTQGSRFFQLRPGSNIIVITKDVPSQSDVQITYRRRRSGF
jgi:hypothetical protein